MTISFNLAQGGDPVNGEVSPHPSSVPADGPEKHTQPRAAPSDHDAHLPQVFCYDPATDTLVLIENKVGAHIASYRYIKAASIDKASVRLSGAHVPPEPLPAISDDIMKRFTPPLPSSPAGTRPRPNRPPLPAGRHYPPWRFPQVVPLLPGMQRINPPPDVSSRPPAPPQSCPHVKRIPNSQQPSPLLPCHLLLSPSDVTAPSLRSPLPHPPLHAPSTACRPSTCPPLFCPLLPSLTPNLGRFPPPAGSGRRSATRLIRRSRGVPSRLVQVSRGRHSSSSTAWQRPCSACGRAATSSSTARGRAVVRALLHFASCLSLPPSLNSPPSLSIPFPASLPPSLPLFFLLTNSIPPRQFPSDIRLFLVLVRAGVRIAEPYTVDTVTGQNAQLVSRVKKVVRNRHGSPGPEIAVLPSPSSLLSSAPSGTPVAHCRIATGKIVLYAPGRFFTSNLSSPGHGLGRWKPKRGGSATGDARTHLYSAAGPASRSVDRHGDLYLHILVLDYFADLLVPKERHDDKHHLMLTSFQDW